MWRESDYVKLRVVVPNSHADLVREALGQAGAGRQGNYDYCSFSYPVTGRFRPRDGAKPAIGAVGRLEQVDEEVIEVICHADNLQRALEAVRQAHPYEEPAIDIMPRYEIK